MDAPATGKTNPGAHRGTITAFPLCARWFKYWLAFGLIFFLTPAAQAQPRLALVRFVGDDDNALAGLLRSMASASAEVSLLDDDLVRVAVVGARYVGSLNLSRSEGRALGQSLGCEFYLLGKLQTARRLGADSAPYFDSLAGVFLVETVSGRLVLFDFQRARGQTAQAARSQLDNQIKAAWPRYVQAVTAAEQTRQQAIAAVTRAPEPIVEVLSDDEVGATASGPIFYQRLKPQYTEQADLADIAATVELEAVFGADGKVTGIEVTKWAGFGLDESAIATVKLLRFQSATREGKSFNLRGLVRYTFRRPAPQAAPSHKSSPAEIERLQRSLREIINPKRPD